MSRKGPARERGLCFWVFGSFAHPDTSFSKRCRDATRAVKRAKLTRVHLVRQTLLRTGAQLKQFEAGVLELGFEGVMLRKPDAPYTFGRVTAHSQALLKAPLDYGSSRSRSKGARTVQKARSLHGRSRWR